MSSNTERIQSILQTIPTRYRGPGGAVAVLKDGNLIAQNVWGYADMEKRIPMSSKVIIPICSITKQFVSSLLLDLRENPPARMASQDGTFDEQMIARLREVLPEEVVDKSDMTVDNLVDMCSGLRDYWALCTVQGSQPDSPYSIIEHNPDMLRRIRSLQFQPGTEYSYSNTNFNVVEQLLEHVTKDSVANLLAERILKPAGMTTAQMCARTDRLPPPIVGYEGTLKSGFVPAPNNIEWSADAGLGASLDDMIAYERYFDRRYIDKDDSYQTTIRSQKYKNGSPALYRYGLRLANIGGFHTIGHGGALRGFKLSRRYVEGERLSVVVLFNHSANAAGAAEYILKQILNVPERPLVTVEPNKNWFGSYLDEDTQLSVRIVPGEAGKIKLNYSRGEETLKLVSADKAETDDMEAVIEGDLIQIHRRDDNRVLHPCRLDQNMDISSKPPVRGRYQCKETESTFICEGEGKMLYGMFDGCFGRGPPHLMTHLGEDVWVLADPRAMDDQAPGDWTVVFERSDDGAVVKATIGCWLARKLEFLRI